MSEVRLQMSTKSANCTRIEMRILGPPISFQVLEAHNRWWAAMAGSSRRRQLVEAEVRREEDLLFGVGGGEIGVGAGG